LALSKQQVAQLGRDVIDGLVRADLLELGGNHDAAAAAVAAEVEKYEQAAAALGAEAEKLADQNLRAAPGGGIGLDRRRVVEMIKKKLAAERGFPL
jgi:hypothetical protein